MDQLAGELTDWAILADDAAGERGLIISRKDQVVANRIGQYETILLPVFGNMAQTRRDQAMRRAVGDILTFQGHVAPGCRTQARQGLDQFRLPVTFDSGDAEDL